jgi:hypothetical protein
MEQRDRIKKVFKDKNLKINDIVAKLFPQGKGSYYNEVDRKPLKEEFIRAVKDEYGFDLVKELENQEKPVAGDNKLVQEKDELNKKIEGLLVRLQEKTDEQLDEVRDALKEILRLNNENRELRKRLGEP